MEQNLEKKVAIIMAFKDFRDAEYFVPKEILERTDIKVTSVSTQKGKALGADGGDVDIYLTLEELGPVDFDAIVFIGGPGALKEMERHMYLKRWLLMEILLRPMGQMLLKNSG